MSPQLRIRAHMRDVCEVGTADAASGPSPNVSFTYANSTRCRYARVNSRNVPNGEKQTLTDIKISLPLGTTITQEDRIKLTKLNGAVLSPERFYAIVGESLENGAEIVLSCRRLVGNAET